MSKVNIAAATRNPMMDALVARMNLGAGAATLKLYSGTMPANADAALSGNTLLATLTFTDPAAPASASGVVTFSTITEDSSADASATATFARIQDSDGNTVFDCDVNTTGSVIVLNTTSIVAGGPVRITSFTLTLPATITY